MLVGPPASPTAGTSRGALVEEPRPSSGSTSALICPSWDIAYFFFVACVFAGTAAAALLQLWYTSFCLCVVVMGILVLKGYLPAQRAKDDDKNGRTTVVPGLEGSAMSEEDVAFQNVYSGESFAALGDIESQPHGRVQETVSAEERLLVRISAAEEELIYHADGDTIVSLPDARRMETNPDDTAELDIDFIQLPPRETSRGRQDLEHGLINTSFESVVTEPSSAVHGSSSMEDRMNQSSQLGSPLPLSSTQSLPGLVVPEMFRLESFDSSDLKEPVSWDCSRSERSPDSIMRALIHPTGPGDLLRQQALISGSKDVLGRFHADPKLVQFLRESVAYISSQPDANARKQAYEEKLREWNKLQVMRSHSLAQQVVRLFCRGMPQQPTASNPLEIGRRILDVQHWQSQMEQALVGVYVLTRARRNFPSHAALMMLSFLAEQPPYLEVGQLWGRDDTIADLDVYANVSQKVVLAKENIRVGVEKFFKVMSWRLVHWLGQPPALTFLEVLRANELMEDLDDDLESDGTGGNVVTFNFSRDPSFQDFQLTTDHNSFENFDNDSVEMEWVEVADFDLGHIDTDVYIS
jgi:hypothetical protein